MSLVFFSFFFSYVVLCTHFASESSPVVVWRCGNLLRRFDFVLCSCVVVLAVFLFVCTSTNFFTREAVVLFSLPTLLPPLLYSSFVLDNTGLSSFFFLVFGGHPTLRLYHSSFFKYFSEAQVSDRHITCWTSSMYI